MVNDDDEKQLNITNASAVLIASFKMPPRGERHSPAVDAKWDRVVSSNTESHTKSYLIDRMRCSSIERNF